VGKGGDRRGKFSAYKAETGKNGKEVGMRRKVLLFTVFVLGIGLLGLAEGEAPCVIKLGAVNPLGDITGDQMTKAMRLAVEEINAAGGVLGCKLELVVVDSEFNPAKGAAAIEKLVTVDKVNVLIGGMSSSVLYGMIPVMKKYQMVTVWSGAAASVCEQALGPEADWFFHLHPWDYLQGQSEREGLMAIIEKYGIQVKKMFVAYEDGVFGTTSYEGLKALFPEWEVVGESFKSAAVGGGDYTAVLQHAKEFDPDVFIWLGYEADALPIMEQAKAIGFEPPMFFGAPPGWPPDFGKSPLSHGVGFFYMWVPAISQVNPVSKHFHDAYVARWDEEPVTYFAPLGYANVYVVAEAIKRAGTLEKEALIKALEETEYLSPLGEVLRFSPSNIIKHQGFKGQKVMQWQNGAAQVIYPFELATAEFIYPFEFGD